MIYCERCGRNFQSPSSYRQHIRDSPNHHVCYDCNKDFSTWHALEQHWIQSPLHHYCRQCGQHFDDEDDLTDHCLNDHFYCDMCDRFFQSALGLAEHNRQCHPTYCTKCKRLFRSENNLREHMNSSIHRPKNEPCAFQHHGCTQWFVSKSAMISHLESGACPSRVDRRMIDRWVRLNDTGHVVTVPRLLTNVDHDDRYIATDRSWNGSAYECILCHNTFRSLADLNRHLASPRHKEKIYRCPLSTCSVTFNALSALCRHVESESCGVLRFRVVRESMDQMFTKMRRLEC